MHLPIKNFKTLDKSFIQIMITALTKKKEATQNKTMPLKLQTHQTHFKFLIRKFSFPFTIYILFNRKLQICLPNFKKNMKPLYK